MSNFKEAVEAAQTSFWETLRGHYPQINTGDFDPMSQLEFDRACENALADWLDANDNTDGGDWGVQENWENVAVEIGFYIDKDLKVDLVQHIDRNPKDRLKAKALMKENGIWLQALQIAKENDFDIN